MIYTHPMAVLVGNPTQAYAFTPASNTFAGMQFIGLTKGATSFEAPEEVATAKSAQTGDSVLAAFKRSPRATVKFNLLEFSFARRALWHLGAKRVTSGTAGTLREAYGVETTNCQVTIQRTLCLMPLLCESDYPTGALSAMGNNNGRAPIWIPKALITIAGAEDYEDATGDDIGIATPVEAVAMLTNVDQASNALPAAFRLYFRGAPEAVFKATAPDGAGLATDPWAIGTPTYAQLKTAIDTLLT